MSRITFGAVTVILVYLECYLAQFSCFGIGEDIDRPKEVRDLSPDFAKGFEKEQIYTVCNIGCLLWNLALAPRHLESSTYVDQTCIHSVESSF